MRSFKAEAWWPVLARTLMPLLTKQLFYGAAISCVVGLGLGLWLEPPKAQTIEPGSMQPVELQPTQATAESEGPGFAAYPPPAPVAHPPAPAPVEEVAARFEPPPRAAPVPVRADVGPPLRLEDAQPTPWDPAADRDRSYDARDPRADDEPRDGDEG
jgi:hypothetical protein